VQHLELADIAKAAISSIEPAADTKGVRLEVVLDPRGGPVRGDAARLQQVFWNLLSNAIKFTPKGGTVQVLLQRVNSHAELRVSDTGIGMPASFLPRMFDRFSQKDGSTARTHGGLGLGLAIAKQLMDLHGGTLQGSSPGEGKGSTFIARIPLAILVEDRADPDRAHPTFQGMEENGLLPSLDGLTVLVVDDEADARDLMQRVLRDRGASVVVAETGPEAVRVIEASPPDVLVCDIGMPNMDGYQVIRRVRASPQGRTLPALALTAFARAEDRKRALLAGFQAHIAKPADTAELVIVIAGLAERVQH
jgi:CheY-like chemotaxis protein